MKTKEEILKGIIGEARFNLSGFVPTGQILQAMETYADQFRNLTPVSENSGGGSYVVFEHSQEQDGLVQLSVTLPTIESARQYVNAWKSKRLSIYLLVK